MNVGPFKYPAFISSNILMDFLFLSFSNSHSPLLINRFLHRILCVRTSLSADL